MKTYDVIVVGIGAMGSAATYQLAQSGAKVLGIDTHTPPHAHGSSHGDTRITRLAIAEGKEYVPMVMRSHEIWRELEEQVGYELLNQCGGLMMSIPGSRNRHGPGDLLQRNVAAAESYDINHTILSNQQLHHQYPMFHTERGEQGYFEPTAGFLRPEECIRAQLALARQYGAEFALGETVLSYDASQSVVTVKTNQDTYQAAKLIVTTGPWITELVPELHANLKTYRQVLYWFDLKDTSQHNAYKNLPVFLWQFGLGKFDYIYGFPMIDGPSGGIKIATHDYSTQASPATMQREVSPAEVAAMYANFVQVQLPGVSATCIKAKTCLYTVSPDNKFIIDFHPTHQNVIIASPCSGHGFKHSAAIGEILSQLANSGQSKINIQSFSLARFSE